MSPMSICTIGDLILDVVVLPDAPAGPGRRHARRRSASPRAARPPTSPRGPARWARAAGLICKRGDRRRERAGHRRARAVRRRGLRPGGRRAAAAWSSRCATRTASARWPPTAAWPRCSNRPSSIRPGCGPATCCTSRATACCASRWPRRRSRRPGWPAASPSIWPRRTTSRSLGADAFAARLTALGPDLVFATEAERAAVPDFDATWVIKLGARGARFPEGVYPAPPVAGGRHDRRRRRARGRIPGRRPELAIEAAARCVRLIGAMPSSASGGPRDA